MLLNCLPVFCNFPFLMEKKPTRSPFLFLHRNWVWLLKKLNEYFQSGCQYYYTGPCCGGGGDFWAAPVFLSGTGGELQPAGICVFAIQRWTVRRVSVKMSSLNFHCREQKWTKHTYKQHIFNSIHITMKSFLPLLILLFYYIISLRGVL